MELHEWLMFFHVLASIVWVGAVILMNVMMTRASRAPDGSAVLRLSRELEWVGPGLIGPSSLVVIGLGIWLVLLEEEWAFSQLWIWLALVLVAVSTVEGIYSGAEGKRVLHLADERGTEDGEVRSRLSRLPWLARLDMLILVVIVWLMVFKPGPDAMDDSRSWSSPEERSGRSREPTASSSRGSALLRRTTRSCPPTSSGSSSSRR